MAQQTINIGAVANDGTGDPNRVAFDKCNNNFTEVYSAASAALARANHTGTQAHTTITGLGTLATQSGTITDYLTSAAAASTYVPQTRTINGQALTSNVTLNLAGIVTSTGNATSIADGAIALSKLATDPLARANHTGTQAWSTLTGTPITLAGYGITDAPVTATITEAGTSRTLALTDAHQWIDCTNASAIAITMPPQASVAWAANTMIYGSRAPGAGVITVTPGSGVTILNNVATTVPAGGSFALRRMASNTWLFI
jgi:hypothetical protein